MSEFMLEIITPEKQFFKGPAEAVMCRTGDGELCVLKGHIPMIAELDIDEMKIKVNGEWKNAFISDGFMEVRPDEVVIFAQSCEWPEEIDAVRAENARRRAEEKLRHARSITEQKHNSISLVRAMTRLKIKKGIG